MSERAGKSESQNLNFKKRSLAKGAACALMVGGLVASVGCGVEGKPISEKTVATASKPHKATITSPSPMPVLETTPESTTVPVTTPESTTTTIPSTTQPKLPVPSAAVNSSIYMLGDSVLQKLNAGPNGLESKLKEQGWKDVMVDAACGRPLIGKPRLQQRCRGEPDSFPGLHAVQQPEDSAFIAKSDVVGIELGTNDFYQSPERFKNTAKELIGIIRRINPVAKISWVNTFMVGQGDSFRGINEAISSLGVEGVNVIDYASQVRQEEYKGNCSDGVHPCPAGAARENQLILSALGSPQTR